MIDKVMIDDNDNVRVIEKIVAPRGIGKKANEVLIFMFNRKQYPNKWKELLKRIKEESKDD